MAKEELKKQIEEFIEHETRSCSMDIAGITPEYIFRMWGGRVSQEDIATVLAEVRMP